LGLEIINYSDDDGRNTQSESAMGGGTQGWGRRVGGGEMCWAGKFGGRMYDTCEARSIDGFDAIEPISQRAYLTASFVVDSLVRANRLEQDKTPVFFFMHRVLSW
jgi:hypothetical protein